MRSSWCPDGVYDHFAAGIGARGAKLRERVAGAVRALPRGAPGSRARVRADAAARAAGGLGDALTEFPADPKGLASRDCSGKVLNALAEKMPLAARRRRRPRALDQDAAQVRRGRSRRTNYGGRNFHFGIREHAMGAICNGMALSKLRPFGSSFLIFSDYMRGSIRLSAIMELPVVWVFTHDSIGVGEDGPTHQPVEQLASLRGDPGAAHDPPVRRERGRRGVARRLEREAQAVRPGAEPAGAADARPQQIRLRRAGSRAAPMCWPTRRTASRR